MVDLQEPQTVKFFKTASDVLKEQGPKMALNSCEKYLKRFPTDSRLLALKAFLLVQLGKDQAGIDIARNLCQTNPIDTETLLQLEKLFIAVNDYKAAIEMFQKAYDKANTEELGIYLFMAILRAEDLKALFTSRGPSANMEKFAKELKLAEHLLMKEYEKSSFKTIEELNLFLLVAASNNDYKIAAKVFFEMESLLVNEYEVSSVKSDILVKNEDWEAAFDFSSKLLLNKGFYDWSIWKCCIEAYKHISENSEANLAMEQILCLDMPKTDGMNERSILLARVDASLAGCSATKMSPAQLLIEYAINSPAQRSRLPDIIFMFGKFSDQEKEEFCSLINRTSYSQEETVFWCQLKRVVMAKLGIWILSEVKQMKILLESLEVKLGEDMVPKKCYLLALLELDEYCKGSGSLVFKIKALKYLKQALILAPGDFMIRTLSTLVYISVGCIFSSLEIFRLLDVKQIQIDSLSYMVSDHLLNLGNINDAEVFFHESFFLYDDNRTQTLSVITESCLKQAYSRIPEFYDLFIRLEHSIQSVGCIVETIRSELTYKPVSHLIEYIGGLKSEELLFTDEIIRKISDNRDTDIIDFLDPSGLLKGELYSKLHSFGSLSIWVFTCLTLMFKALSTGDCSALHSLKTNYDRPGYFEEKKASPLALRQATFVQILLDVFADLSLSNTLSFDKLFASLKSKVSSADLPGKIESYDDVSAYQWCVERIRWASLALAFYVQGQKPKVRRTAVRLIQPSVAFILGEFKGLSIILENVCLEPSDGLENQSEKEIALELKMNWERSLKNFRVILELSKPIAEDLKH